MSTPNREATLRRESRPPHSSLSRGASPGHRGSLSRRLPETTDGSSTLEAHFRRCGYARGVSGHGSARRGDEPSNAASRRRRRRWIVLGALLPVVLAIAGAGAYVLVIKHEGRDVRGSSQVEFDPADVPTSSTPTPGTREAAKAQQAHTVAWATYGFDARRLRVAPPSNLRPPFRTVWMFRGKALLEFPPAIAYGRLFMPTFDGRFYALDPATGKTIWGYTSGRCAWASPAVAGGLVFETFLGHAPRCFANSTENDGQVLAFDARSGRVRWRTRLGSVESSPLVVGRRLFVGDWSGDVVALATTNGRLLWRYHTGGAIKGSAAYANGLVYVGSYDGHLYALNPRTGALVWRASAQPRLDSTGTFYSTPGVAYGRVYIGSTDGKVYSYGASSGKLRWSFSTGGWVYSSPAIWRRLVLIGSFDGSFYALDAATGQPRWRFRSNGHVIGSATVVNGVVYFSTLADRTYALDASTGRQLWTWPNGRYSPVVSDDTRLYLVGYSRMWGMVPR